MLNSSNLALISCLLFFVIACDNTEDPVDEIPTTSAIETTFGNSIDLQNLPNYESQSIPAYITKDNTGSNVITNEGATLGRVLFYDKNLSIDNSISCSSCHQQSTAFSDDARASIGVNGTTGRHSMRLVNSRFAEELKFFWDERAATLEAQTTQPIQDHIEMGFSGEEGNPAFDGLITKLSEIDYYTELFAVAYGDAAITEARVQDALAQFIRSMQSFDSKFDIGRAMVTNDNQVFPNFSNQENEGKNLFLARPVFDQNGTRTSGGLGCAGCHVAPEFDIAPNSLNNGVIGTLDGTDIDLTITRSPSLRDVFNPNGNLNGPLMHTGDFTDIESVLEHYNNITLAGNNNLDPKLRPNGQPQKLSMTQQEVTATVAFIKTLTGTSIYSDTKWSDPFAGN